MNGPVELPLRKKCARLVQNLVNLPQLAVLTFQRLEPVGQFGRHTGALAAIELGLLHRHALMSMIAFAFLQARRLTARVKKKKPEPSAATDLTCHQAGRRS
ncbi:MAG: hypothetical protein CFE32_19930 [Alphaproteobacteria bacterium PA3]|nr:MAG: hypothetical protein CFE32_19930 [Alphaproteobacteria bacterium PA3]